MSDDALVIAESEVEIETAEFAAGGESLAEQVTQLAEERGLAEIAPVRESDPFEIVQRAPMRTPRAWQLDFGPVSGDSGTVTTVMIQPRCYFRGENILAADTAEKSGTGTVITQIFVGQKLQRLPLSTPFRTSLFRKLPTGLQVKMDVCEPSLGISVTVSFIESCTFDLTMFGKAII